MRSTLLCALIALPVSALADVTVEMHAISDSGSGASIGTVTASDSPHGLLLTPALHDLPPGLHGFHLHEKPSCDAAEKDGQKKAGLAAGGHFDPKASAHHDGPYAGGHLGDLPGLYVDGAGKAAQPVLAPRIKTADLAGHALMIHAGGDNYADKPEPLGGGGARIACGVVK